MIEVKHVEGLSEMLRKASDELLSPANPKEDVDPFLAAVLLAAERFIDLQFTEIASLRAELIRARKDAPPPAVIEIDAESADDATAVDRHRHVFKAVVGGGPDLCTKCGKAKAAGGRPPAPPVSNRQVEAPLAPVPPPVPSLAPPRLRNADDFEDGTMGGSGVRR